MILDIRFGNGGIWSFWTSKETIDEAIVEFQEYISTLAIYKINVMLYPTEYSLINKEAEVVEKKFVKPDDDNNWVEIPLWR